ncbi:head maturation protease, ClpP-related [Bacillus thuringiensis]|uniref:ATP-dependent Clp protease proteolytic subunit n=1 Tax=Bacillus thuringiensis TaxID=1428 RepID=A0A9W3VH34_BACTU|nr:head maturation protease, ClpP-related [Bacillus thuringiensis]AMR06342.1 peptidase [Bacillus thuringiensis]AYF85146.1 Clp protease ClpP [Bacillus thuringiensis]PNK35450.1 peptidase [Bacillus thuringiensis]
MDKRKDNLNNFLQVKNMTETSADLYFYGDIVSSWWGAWEDEDQYPENVKTFLDSAKGKDLNIYINSGGGAVFAGVAIYNMIKRHQGYKRVYVDGLAASIASVIALAGDEVVIPANAFFMIHKPWTSTWGNAEDLRKAADTLDTVEEGILNIYAENLKEGVSIDTIREFVAEEKWFTGNEAAEFFDIKVTDEVQAVACISDMYKEYQHTPKNLLEQKQNKKIDRTNEFLFDF